MAFVQSLPLCANRIAYSRCVRLRRPAARSARSVVWRAVAARESDTQDDVQDLMRQLQELRAKRDALAQRASSAKSAPAPAAARKAQTARDGSKPLELGQHGESSRFMPMTTVIGGEQYPRILAVLDLSGGATPTDFVDCPSLTEGVQESGKLTFVSVPDAFKWKLTAIAPTGKLLDMKDPVALLVPHDVLGPSVSLDDGSPVVLIIERGAPEEHDPYKFYVWDDQGVLCIGWHAEAGSARCLGQVVCALIEEPAERRKAKSCWEEESEVY